MKICKMMIDNVFFLIQRKKFCNVVWIDWKYIFNMFIIFGEF